MSYTLPHAVYTAFDETTKLYTAYQMQAAYQAGRASRDAEVEDWKRGSDAEAKEVDRLTKEVEALRADALRYRFCIDNNMVLSGGVVSFGWPIAPVGAQWNKYIDAAMRKEK